MYCIAGTLSQALCTANTTQDVLSHCRFQLRITAAVATWTTSSNLDRIKAKALSEKPAEGTVHYVVRRPGAQGMLASTTNCICGRPWALSLPIQFHSQDGYEFAAPCAWPVVQSFLHNLWHTMQTSTRIRLSLRRRLRTLPKLIQAKKVRATALVGIVDCTALACLIRAAFCHSLE